MFGKIASRIRFPRISVYRGFASKAADAGWGRFTKPERGPDGFYIDTRRGQRQVILKEWVSRNGRKFRFELADDADFDMAMAFWAETFKKTSNIVEKLDPEEHELYPVLVPMAEAMIAQKNIVLCFEDNRLVGKGMGGTHDGPEFDLMFGRGEAGCGDKKVNIKDDYAADIEKLPYSPKMNIIMAFIRACFFQTLPFLPKTTNRVGILEVAAVHPDLQAEGIGSIFVPLMVDRLARQKSDMVISLAVAHGTYKIAQKMGVDIMFEIPFDQFKVNGKSVFTNLCDGATKAAMVGRKFDHKK